MKEKAKAQKSKFSQWLEEFKKKAIIDPALEE